MQTTSNRQRQTTVKMLDARGEEGQQPRRLTPTPAQFRLALTLIMGATIPLFSLALSNIGGTLANSHLLLAGFAFTLMACVLAVSLSHLAWAIEDITKSKPWASWLLAVSFDLALVLGELCKIMAEEAGVGLVTSALMVAVCGLSMFLNCWAFLKHPGAEARAAKAKGKAR
jgi:hypothetical protein